MNRMASKLVCTGRNPIAHTVSKQDTQQKKMLTMSYNEDDTILRILLWVQVLRFRSRRSKLSDQINDHRWTLTQTCTPI